MTNNPSPSPHTVHSAGSHAVHSAGSTSPTNKKGLLIGLGVLALLALIAGAIAAVKLFSAQPTETDGSTESVQEPPAQRITSEQQRFTPDMLKTNFKDGKLVECDLGGEFFEKVGLEDWERSDGNAADLGSDSEEVSHPAGSVCSGWIQANEAQVQSALMVSDFEEKLSRDHLAFPPDEEGLEEWSMTESPFTDKPKCTMLSTRPELMKVQLNTTGPCELLYPLAIHLNNVANYYLDHGSGETAKYVDPARWDRLSIASDTYNRLHSGAVSAGTAIELRSAAIEGSTHTLESVEMTNKTISGVGKPFDVPYVCVSTTLKVGEFISDDATDVTIPTVTVLYPNDNVVELKPEPGDHSMKENSPLALKYCGMLEFPVRDGDVLIATSDLLFREDAGAWKARLEKEPKIRQI